MNAERIAELLALKLYGELDTNDERELEALCADADAARFRARYEADLARGLGAVSGATADEGLPAGWRERIATEVTHAPPMRPTRTPWWLAAAAGFVGGALLVGAIRSDDTSSDVPVAATPDASEFQRFAVESPPPVATAGSRWARLGEYVR